MRRIALLALALAACAPAEQATLEGSYLYVWAGAQAEGESDFVAVIDADPESERYGEIVATVPTGPAGVAHHSEHQMPKGDTLFVNAFRSGTTYLVDLSTPTAPRLAGQFDTLAGYTHPHSYARLPSGNVLMTYQALTSDRSKPGGLVEVTPSGQFVRASGPATNPVDSQVRPYSVTPLPDIDRVITTTTDMHGVLEASSFQVWRLSDLALLHTITLPRGPNNTEQFDPAEVRVMDDGTVILTTFRCGMYRLTDLESELPQAELIYSWPWTAYEEDVCALGVPVGKFWVQTVANRAGSWVVSLDMSNPSRPVEVGRVRIGRPASPHWLSADPRSNRLVLTSGAGRTQYHVVLLRYDRTSGAIVLDTTLRDPVARIPGISFNRTSWPHGEAGKAKPHGAVFSR